MHLGRAANHSNVAARHPLERIRTMHRIDTELVESARTIIGEDVVTYLKEHINICVSAYQKAVENRKNQVRNIIDNNTPASIFIILGIKFDAQNFINELGTCTLFSAQEQIREWEQYYAPRKLLLEQLYKKAGFTGEFPDLPISYIRHNLLMFPLNTIDENTVSDIRRSTIGKFWPSWDARFSHIVKNYFPILEEGFEVPSTFIETILDQSVRLWGKPAKDVFCARRWLLLDVVLKESLEKIRQYATEGYKYSQQEQDVFLQEYSTLREPIYRELNNLAARVPGHHDTLGKWALFNADKLKDTQEKISGETYLDKWYSAYDVELVCMRNYFNSVI